LQVNESGKYQSGPVNQSWTLDRSVRPVPPFLYGRRHREQISDLVHYCKRLFHKAQNDLESGIRKPSRSTYKGIARAVT